MSQAVSIPTARWTGDTEYLNKNGFLPLKAFIVFAGKQPLFNGTSKMRIDFLATLLYVLTTVDQRWFLKK